MVQFIDSVTRPIRAGHILAAMPDRMQARLHTAISFGRKM